MERWKIYKRKNEYKKTNWIRDIMDIKVRIRNQKDCNGQVSFLLERVESGFFQRIIGTNGEDGYACIEYGNMDRKSI